MAKRGVGIIGCGAIGTIVAAVAGEHPRVDPLLVYDTKVEAAAGIAAMVGKARVRTSLVEVLAEATLIVEAASIEAARMVLPQALKMGREVLLLSTGALVDDGFRAQMVELASHHGGRIYLPSGAIAGVDGVGAAAGAPLRRVELITTKPPAALAGAPAVVAKGIDLHALTEPMVVFSGPANEAIRLFPKNVNVAATLSIAGIGAYRTMVTIIADPAANRNTHRIVVEGEFGAMSIELANQPHPDNPATSHLAALSAGAALKRILGPLWVGA